MDEPPAFEVDAEIIGSQEVTVNGHVARVFQLRSAPVVEPIDPRNRQPLVWPEDMDEDQVKALLLHPVFRLGLMASVCVDEERWQELAAELEVLSQSGHLVGVPLGWVKHMRCSSLYRLMGKDRYADWALQFGALLAGRAHLRAIK